MMRIFSLLSILSFMFLNSAQAEKIEFTNMEKLLEYFQSVKKTAIDGKVIPYPNAPPGQTVYGIINGNNIQIVVTTDPNHNFIGGPVGVYTGQDTISNNAIEFGLPITVDNPSPERIPISPAPNTPGNGIQLEDLAPDFDFNTSVEGNPNMNLGKIESNSNPYGKPQPPTGLGGNGIPPFYYNSNNPFVNGAIARNKAFSPRPEVMGAISDFEKKIRTQKEELEKAKAETQAQQEKFAESLRSAEIELAQLLEAQKQTSPAPIPTGVDAMEIARELYPFRKAYAQKGSLLETSDALKDLMKTISAYQHTGVKRAESKYLSEELQRTVLDHQYLLKGLRYADFKGYGNLITSPTSVGGSRIRNVINETLASEEILGIQCTQSDSYQESCLQLGQHIDEIKTLSVIADRMTADASMGLTTQQDVNQIMSGLETASSTLRGFAGGVAKGAVNFAEGIQQLISSPAQTVAGLAHAFTHIPETYQIIKQAVETEWQNFQNGTAEQRAEIVGKLAFEAGVTYLTAGASASAKNAFMGSRIGTAIKEAAQAGKASLLNSAAAGSMVNYALKNISKIPLSAKAEDFILRVYHNTAQRTKDFNYTSLETKARSYLELESAMSKVAPIENMEVRVYRAIKSELNIDDSTLVLTQDDVFNFNLGNISSEHRFSQPGQGAIYGTIGQDADLAIKTAQMEAIKDGEKFIIGSADVKFDRVLDLTDKSTLDQLGLSTEKITLKLKGDPSAYDITQQIGDLAEKFKFDAIKSPSAANPGGTTITILKDIK